MQAYLFGVASELVERGSYGHPRRMLIRAGGRLPLLRRGPRYEDDGDQRLTIDLSELEFASPLELAAVASLGNASAFTRDVRVLVPRRTAVASYLQRMDLFARLAGAARVVGTLPSETRKHLPQTLLEVRAVGNSEEGMSLSDWFCTALEARLGSHETHAPFKMFGELLDNAWTHGVSPAGAFAAAQYYSGLSTGRPGLEFAICDSGVGVLDHLRRNTRYSDVTSAMDALRLAFEPGVTGTADYRGMGLSDVLSLVERAGRASLVFASGDAAVHHRMARDGLKTNESALADPIDGTWVWLRVHLPMTES
jgi:hypothetical protein